MDINTESTASELEIPEPQRRIQPSRHIDQLMLQTRVHHMHLSSMADIKANIMLTLAALIVTFSIGYLDDPLLRWPVMVMIGFCIITILASAYAVMPMIDWGLGKSNTTKTPGHILFFGNFLHMEYEAYWAKMQHIIDEPERVYEAQVREIYELGTYLGHNKFRYIRIAYQSFLLGILSSAVVLGVVILLSV
jgi:hypothetical protein